MTIDGATHAWGDAFGNRDRSWALAAGRPVDVAWFSINLGESMHWAHPSRTSAGDLHRGWVLKDAQGRASRSGGCARSWPTTGSPARRPRRRRGQTDRTFALTGEVQRVADIGRAGARGQPRADAMTYRADDGSTLSAMASPNTSISSTRAGSRRPGGVERA